MLSETADQPLDSVADLLKDAGHLWTAQGNSGVILSQVVRGLAEGVDGCTVIDAGDLAAGLAGPTSGRGRGYGSEGGHDALGVAGGGPGVREPAASASMPRRSSSRPPRRLWPDTGTAAGPGPCGCRRRWRSRTGPRPRVPPERLAAGDDGRVMLGLSSSDRRGRLHPEAGALLWLTRPLDADVVPHGEPTGPGAR